MPQVHRSTLIRTASAAIVALTVACATFAPVAAQQPIPVPGNMPLPPRNGLPVPPPPQEDAEPEIPAEAPEAPVEGEEPAVFDEPVAEPENAEPFAPASATQTAVARPAPALPTYPTDDAPDEPVLLTLDAGMPEAWASALRDAVAATPNLEGPNGAQSIRLVNGDESGNAGIAVVAPEADGYAIAQRYFGVVAPFDTIEDDIALDEVRSRWQGGGAVFTTQEGLGLLPAILGEAGDGVSAVDGAEMIARLEENRDAIGILPFDGLDPRFKVLTVDGANLLSNQLEAGTWPLVAEVHVSGEGAGTVAAALAPAIGAWTNRDPSAMTQLVMTGVTAMARGTAEAMEREGFTYPAEIIGPELATADITHVSNEIPFIDGCEVRNFEDNLVLCSDLPYWQALELMGTDIVGLSGNHVNDFGRDGARQSLTWYRENNIPIYGSGFNTEEACAPLLWEHNGNTFAFLAALAFDPVSAQATDSEPGACYFYDNKERIIRSIESLSEAVDVVAVELQYEETYVPYPTPNQVDEFRELRAAGADLVTGVQSHVPQAQEPYGRGEAGGPGMISYGLGNLFFDQMWSWETRSELYVRHTIYNGEIISSEILTGVLEDFAQPRWATPEERADILSTIYGGAPERP